MHYPLTIEQFRCPQFETDNGREFITNYIKVVNNYYEAGRREKNSGIHFTVDMVKGWYEQLSDTKVEGEEDMMFFEIFAEDINKAWQSGVRASGEVLAKAHGIQSVPIRYGRRQIVRASHKPGGKLYTWELPGILINRVSAGDRVLVHSQRGIKAIRVAEVEEYAGQEQEPLRMVIRVKKRAARHGKR